MGFYSWIMRFYLSSFSHGIYRDGSEGGAMMALNLELPILFQELGLLIILFMLLLFCISCLNSYKFVTSLVGILA